MSTFVSVLSCSFPLVAFGSLQVSFCSYVGLGILRNRTRISALLGSSESKLGFTEIYTRKLSHRTHGKTNPEHTTLLLCFMICSFLPAFSY